MAATMLRAPRLSRTCVSTSASRTKHSLTSRAQMVAPAASVAALRRVRLQEPTAGRARHLVRCRAEKGQGGEAPDDEKEEKDVMIEAEAAPAEALAPKPPSAEEESTMDWGEWDEGAMYASLGTEDVKSVLLDTIVGTDRGFSPNSETRAEINELIGQLEALNPVESPTESLDMLAGNWRLLYTSNSELFVFLALNTLPLLKIGDIYQNIDGVTGTVVNELEVITPLARGSVSAKAAIEVRSPKRLQVKFTESTLSTPTLVTDLQLPNAFEFNGQKIDFSPLQGAADQLTTLLRPASEALSKLPDLKFPIPESGNPAGESWLLTTYLDDTLRIARGDAGSIFVLEKVEA